MNPVELINSKVELLKKPSEDGNAFTPVYKESVNFSERVSVHSEIGEFPMILFKERAPNQTAEEFNYIKANHKTITFPIWSRFIGVQNRIWSDQNWSIEWPKGSEDLQKYFEKGIPKYGNYESYFKNIVTPLKQKDANALMLIKPYEIPIKRTETGAPILDEDGNAYVDDTQELRPYPYIANSKNVLAFEEGEYALIMTEEKSLVKVGNREERSGFVMEYYDKEFIYIVTQTGKKTDWTYEIHLYWQHDLGYLPGWKLKGIPLLRDCDILYQPHFMCAIESLDSALLDNSYLMAIKAGAAFPHKWEYVNQCEYQGDDGTCVGGRVFKDGKEHECPSCKGSGNSKPSILGVYQIKMPTRTNDITKDLNMPPFGWESPKFDPMEFLRKEIELHKNEALSILNLQNSVTNAQGSDTALGKIIDREELFSFILSISNQLFELYENSMKAIIDMKSVKEVEHPNISYPKNFSIRNENDITQEISAAKAANAPDIAIRALLIEYLNIRFNTESNTTKIVDLAFAADRLITLSSLEIQQKLLAGTIAKWEDVLHVSIQSFITQAMSEDDNFFSKKLSEQVAKMHEMAKAKLLEISPAVDSTQSILDASAASGGGVIAK